MKFILIILLASLNACKSQTCKIADTSAQQVSIADSFASNEITDTSNGIIYFSSDEGATWQNNSNGLPDSVSLTDIAVAEELLGITTKQHGIFLFDFLKNSWVAIATNPATTDNLDALCFYDRKIVVGTESDGIFISDDQGKTWASYNKGLKNFAIRKFAVVQNRLFIGTNGGLYSLNEPEKTWVLEYGHNKLQVNGITELDGDMYIGTNQGVFKTTKQQTDWKQIMPNYSLHNISSAGSTVYALVYNELFASADKGNSWQSIQKGLPDGLYTFQLMKINNTVLAGQWDGVYKKSDLKVGVPLNTAWVFSSMGLPGKFAVTEMKIYKKLVIAGCSERKLRSGVTIKTVR